MKLKALLSLIFLSAQPGFTAPVAGDVAAEALRPVLVARFQNGTWPETIAARSNGQLLVTRFTNKPAVYAVDPLATTTPNYRLIAQFPQYDGKQGVGGLAEFKPDVFAVAIGRSRYDDTVGRTVFERGPTEIYTLDFTAGAPLPAVQQLTTVRGAGFLNGLTHIPGSKYLLSADSVRGVVYRIDTITGSYKVVLSDPTMTVPPNASVPLSINGIQVDSAGRYAYFDNSARMLLARIPIHPDGSSAGDAKIIAKLETFADDFLLKEKHAFVATNPSNSVLKISLENGSVEVLSGAVNSTDLPGATSIAHGRTARDSNSLYVTCNGGLAAPVNGNYTERGSVKALKL